MNRAPRNRAEALEDIGQIGSDVLSNLGIAGEALAAVAVGVFFVLVALVAFLLDECRLFWLRVRR